MVAGVGMGVGVCEWVCVGKNKDREVEEVGEKEVSTELGGLLSALPRGPPDVSRGSQSHQYQSELYLHTGCKETQCKHVSGSVSNWRK